MKMTLIALMMEAVRASETLVYSNKTTQRSIPEGCQLQGQLKPSTVLLTVYVSLLITTNKLDVITELNAVRVCTTSFKQH
jgi:hypothetical protein